MVVVVHPTLKRADDKYDINSITCPGALGRSTASVKIQRGAGRAGVVGCVVGGREMRVKRGIGKRWMQVGLCVLLGGGGTMNS